MTIQTARNRSVKLIRFFFVVLILLLGDRNPDGRHYKGTSVKLSIMFLMLFQMFQQTKAKIKGIGSEKVGSAQEEQVKINLQQSLAHQLQELSVTFKKNQKDYLQSAVFPLFTSSLSRVVPRPPLHALLPQCVFAASSFFFLRLFQPGSLGSGEGEGGRERGRRNRSRLLLLMPHRAAGSATEGQRAIGRVQVHLWW